MQAAQPQNQVLDKLRQDLQTSVEKIIGGYHTKLLQIANDASPPQNPVNTGNGARPINPTQDAANPTQAAAAAANPNLPKYKSLPWFKHGIRHFLNKLWHGDHPSNPSWQGVQRIEHRLNLQEYAAIKQDISDFCFNFFESEGNEFEAMFKTLSSDITRTVTDYVNKAYELGVTGSKAAEPSDNPTPTPEPQAQSAPEPTKTPEPEPTPEQQPETPTEPEKEASPLLDKIKKRNRLAQSEAPVEQAAEVSPEDFAKHMAHALKNGGDPSAVSEIARKAGIKFGKSKKGITDAASAEKIVRMVRLLGKAGIFTKRDWKQSPQYPKILPQLKIRPDVLDSAIMSIDEELYNQEKEQAAAQAANSVDRPKVFGQKGVLENQLKENPISEGALSFRNRIRLITQ